MFLQVGEEAATAPHAAPAPPAPTGLGDRMGNRRIAICRTARRYVEQVTVVCDRARSRPSSTTCASSASGWPTPTPRWAAARTCAANTSKRSRPGCARHPRAGHRQTAQPGQHQERADQPALLPDPDHRMGLPEPAGAAADVPLRSADQGRSVALVSRRRCLGQAAAPPLRSRPVHPLSSNCSPAPGSARGNSSA